MTSDDEWDALPSVVGIPLPEEDDEPAETSEEVSPADAAEEPAPLALEVVRGVTLPEEEDEEPEAEEPVAARPMPPPPIVVPRRAPRPDPSRWRSAPPPAASDGTSALPEIPAIPSGPNRSSVAEFDALLAEEGSTADDSASQGPVRRISLSDMELVDEDPPARISLSDMELVDEDPPAVAPMLPLPGLAAPPPIPPSDRVSLVNVEELLEEAARAESTRPVVMARPQPVAEEPRAKNWPALALVAAACLLIGYAYATGFGASSGSTDHDGERVATRQVPGSGASQPQHAASSPRAPTPALAAAEASAEPLAAVQDAQEPLNAEQLAPHEPDTSTETTAPAHTGQAARAPQPRRPGTRRPGTRRPGTQRPGTQRPTTSPQASRPARPEPAAPAPSAAPSAPSPAAPAVVPAPAPPPRQAVENRADLPDAPSRDEVQAAFTAVLPNLRACTDSHGAVPIRVTISGSGRVTTAMVQGHFAGTPEGSCLARAVRTARLPAFRQRRINVNFPFVL